MQFLLWSIQVYFEVDLINFISALVILFVSFPFIILHLVPNINVAIAGYYKFLFLCFWTTGEFKFNFDIACYF
jgi:hypothetical protein